MAKCRLEARPRLMTNAEAALARETWAGALKEVASELGEQSSVPPPPALPPPAVESGRQHQAYKFTCVYTCMLYICIYTHTVKLLCSKLESRHQRVVH